MDENKVGPKVEDGEENKEEDDNNLEVLDKDVDGANDDEEEDINKKTKEEMLKNLSFFKGVVEIDNCLLINVNKETLQDSNIIKVIYKKLVRKTIEILRKLAEKDESKKVKDEDIVDVTKEAEINENGEVEETENDELFADAANDAPPLQDDMTTTTEAAAKEDGDDNDHVGTEEGKD